MSGGLLVPVCTFRRVFETEPQPEVLTLPELTAALRRFEIKPDTAARIEREVARIRRGAEKLVAGEPPRGKFMGKLHRAAEAARVQGRDPAAAVEAAAEALVADARRGAKRDLRLWSPTLYRPGATERSAQNVTHVSCLVLDYDDGTEIDEASTTWSAWFHLVYTTWSHTPDHPRFRLVLPLAFAVPAEDWGAVWAWAEEHAHFRIDPAMKSPAATYALPAVPHRAWPREAFSRPGAILDPVDEGILGRRPALELAPRRPPAGTPSVMRGEDPDKEYVDHEDLEAPAWEDAAWEPPPEVVASLGGGPPAERERAADAAPDVESPDRGAGPPSTEVEAPRSVATDAAGDAASLAALVDRLEGAVVALEAARRPLALVEGLERLVKLHEAGHLTKKELRQAKARLLEAGAPAGELRRVGKGRHRKTICVDFDGVIHSYASGWRGATEIPDPPVDGAIEWLARAAERFDLAITSVRNAQPGAIEAMRAWLRAHGLPERVLERVRFPRHKLPAEIYVDDRAFRFEGTFPSFETLGALEPWTRKRRR